MVQGDQKLLRCRAIHEKPIHRIHRLAPMLLQQFEVMKFQTATLPEDEFSIRLLQMKNGIEETFNRFAEGFRLLCVKPMPRFFEHHDPAVRKKTTHLRVIAWVEVIRFLTTDE